MSQDDHNKMDYRKKFIVEPGAEGSVIEDRCFLHRQRRHP